MGDDTLSQQDISPFAIAEPATTIVEVVVHDTTVLKVKVGGTGTPVAEEAFFL